MVSNIISIKKQINCGIYQSEQLVFGSISDFHPLPRLDYISLAFTDLVQQKLEVMIGCQFDIHQFSLVKF